MGNPYSKCKECNYSKHSNTSIYYYPIPCRLNLGRSKDGKCYMEIAWDEGYERGFKEGTENERYGQEGSFF